jgi:hypothetical protein
VSLYAAVLNDPERLRKMRDEETQGFLKRNAGYGFQSECRRYFVESWLGSRSEALPNLKYIQRGFALLGAEEIKLALADIERALGLVRTEDWSYFALDGLSIEDAVSAQSELLWSFAECDGNDHDNPYYLIAYLRGHRRIFEEALGDGERVLYVLYDHA